MKRNQLAACICLALVMQETRERTPLRWHWRPKYCPRWAWNLRSVRRLLMRWCRG